MSAKIYGIEGVFGVTTPLPLIGFPAGKVRIKMRAGEFAKVFIRDAGGIRCFIPRKDGEFWVIATEVAANRLEMVCFTARSYKPSKEGRHCWCLEKRLGTCWGIVFDVDGIGKCQGHLDYWGSYTAQP